MRGYVSAVARPTYPRSSGPLPPALPPEVRPVGQVVAEALRVYGARFAMCLPLGIPVAVADQLTGDRPYAERAAVLALAAPFFTLAYAAACAIRQGETPARGRWVEASLVGTVIFLPAAAMLPGIAVLAVLYLALVGHAVPVLMAEGGGPVASVRRSLTLARADYVHAAGSLATLVLLFFITRQALGFVLRSQADNTVRLAIFLSDLVVSPLLFLGAAMVYVDLVARLGTSRADRRRLYEAAIGRAPK